MIERQVCQCEDLDIGHCWKGDFVIIREVPGRLGYHGTALYHSKCGLPVEPRKVDSLATTDRERLEEAASRSIFKP